MMYLPIAKTLSS